MRKLILIFALVLFTTAGLVAQNNENTTVMSFNIRYDNPKDGVQNWHNRKENVVRMLHFYEVDIIGMQEVLNTQLQYLKENLEQYNSIGVGREDGKTKGELAPILYKKERFEEIESGTFWLSETPKKVSKGWDAALERIATWAIFLDKNNNTEFVFINTHFDHRGHEARIESSRLIKKKAHELAGTRPIILTGDFNLTPESEGIKLLLKPEKSNSFLNSSEIAKYTYGPNWTTCGFDGRPFDKRKVIDYVFVKGIKRVNRYAVFAEMLNEIYLSDHCPVFVDLEY